MDKELENALEAHKLADDLFAEHCRENAPLSIRVFVLHVRNHLSKRIEEIGLRFGE